MSNNPEKWIQINLTAFELDYIEKDWSVLSYPVGIGREETPTPTGIYFIFSMEKDPQRIYRVDDRFPPDIFGTRSINLSVQAFDLESWCWRHYSIHGTNDDSLIPGRCSHGCIRMKNKDIEELYERCEPGMLVTIV